MGKVGSAAIRSAAAVACACAIGVAASPAPATQATSMPRVTVNFEPHGISLSGLQSLLPAGRGAAGPHAALSAGSLATIRAQIAAARRYWHSNTIRLQIQQDKLVGQRGDEISPAYLADIRSLVAYAESLGLVVVLSCSTLRAPGFTANEPLPTHATVVFWRTLDRYYRNDGRVVYDLFNEPRTASWPQWRAAYQRTLDDVRHQGSRNIIWIDSIRGGNTMRGLWPYRLSGDGLVYSFHHPLGPHTPANWYQTFRYLQPKGLHLVNGEFSNWAGGYCWNDAPTAIPLYLNYLRDHHIGMTAWTLKQGVLNSTSEFSSATTMYPNFSCYAGVTYQGAGKLIQEAFANW